MLERLSQALLNRPQLAVIGVFVAVLALPIAAWLDLEGLSDKNMRNQAHSINSLITTVRNYYSENVSERINAHAGPAVTLHDYHDVPGAIPIPATLSIELGQLISDQEGDVTYRFFSDYPFANRPVHPMSDFEQNALTVFRAGTADELIVSHDNPGIWAHIVTLAAPIEMLDDCVACHNTHPESTKTDWQVGDIRGLQVVRLRQPIPIDIWSFKWMMGYMAITGTVGLIFAFSQFRLASSFSRLNGELTANNEFLAGVSLKISKYLSPQVYRSIFSGEKDATISTERKKLTVFFSDVKDFTATTELLQPEELTNLLNEYFTEMSRIAEDHGATIDKFIGDAIVAFFGDPDTKGTTEDARACVRMALAMQARLAELETVWRDRGLEHPFKVRMGINTGYCNVGNFGSQERMDYTIIGAEANLAARLESIAEPGGIVMSYETYAHVRDMVEAYALPPEHFKGIAREVVPYRINALQTEKARSGNVLTIDLEALPEEVRKAVRDAVETAIKTATKPA